MNRDLSLAEQIAQVERKLDLRRQRTRRHWDETRSALHRLTGKLPLLAAAGALAAGVMAGRSRPAPAPAMTAPGTARVGVAATVFTVASTLARLATSPAARSLWQAYRASRRSGAGTAFR
jgi:hypothetical protein